MSTSKPKAVQETTKTQSSGPRARLRSDTAVPRATGGGTSKQKEADSQAQSTVIHLSAVSPRKHAALRGALKAQLAWKAEANQSQTQSSLKASRQLIRQIDAQRDRVELGLREAQGNITLLYKSLMENEAIRGSLGDWQATSPDSSNGDADTSDVLTGLPPKAKNAFHFKVIKVEGKSPSSGEALEQGAKQETSALEAANQSAASAWPGSTHRLPKLGQAPPTEENEPHNQNKVNSDSLANALCNDNSLIKADELLREQRREQTAGVLAGSRELWAGEPLQPPAAVSSFSSPFASKGREPGGQGPMHGLLSEGDARKLATVDNPANLYIHEQLRKKIYKHVAVNYHEAPGAAPRGKPAARVRLEGFGKRFLAAQRGDGSGELHGLRQLPVLPNCYSGDSLAKGRAGPEVAQDPAESNPEQCAAAFSFERARSGLADVEMLTNLGQPYNNGYCHLNPIYDFQPANVEMLVMARLAFSVKKDRILSFMRKAASRNCEAYQRYGQCKKEAFPAYHRQQAAQLQQMDRELLASHPQVYRQHYQSTKSKTIGDAFNIQFNEFGEIQDIVQKTQLCSFHVQQRAEGISLENQPASTPTFSPDCYMCTNLGSGRPDRRVRGQGEEDEDEMWRYKENFAKITRIKTDIYSNLRICVDVRAENRQQDPVAYELEHKRRQVWSVQELKTFFSVLSDAPKCIWVASSRLPHKTAKEILYFYQAFAGLMRFEAFQADVAQARHQLKNQKERVPQAVAELIERRLEPLHSHLARAESLQAPDRIFQASGEHATDPSTSRFDSRRLNLQELVEIYAKVSAQRRQREREARGAARDAGEAAPATATTVTSQERAAALGQLPVNAFRRGSSPEQAASVADPSSLPFLPYFAKVEQVARRILQYYLANSQLVDQLCANKREFLHRFFGFNCSRLTYASLLQVPQHEAFGFSRAFHKREVRQGKRKLGEFLAQGDFFNGGGKLGYYYQHKNLLSEVELNGTKRVAKRGEENGALQGGPGASPLTVYANSPLPQIEPPVIDSENKQSFTISFLNKRAAKLLEKQIKFHVQNGTKAHGQVEVHKTLQAQLTDRLFFSSAQMELDVEELLQEQRNTNTDCLTVNEPDEQEEEKTATKGAVESRSRVMSTLTTPMQLEEYDRADNSDSGQVTGPVNQPTLFGSSIKAQNQWQRDEKDQFVKLLQTHGRNWHVIAGELPRRTPQQCRNYFQNYKYKLRLGRYLPPSDELHVSQDQPAKK